MTISLFSAERLISDAKQKAEEIDVPVNIVVVDGSGFSKAFIRMDGGAVSQDFSISEAAVKKFNNSQERKAA